MKERRELCDSPEVALQSLLLKGVYTVAVEEGEKVRRWEFHFDQSSSSPRDRVMEKVTGECSGRNSRER